MNRRVVPLDAQAAAHVAELFRAFSDGRRVQIVSALMDGERDVSALAEQSERQADVRRALHRLTPEQQHVLSLRFGSELSLEETAQLMERSVNAIKALQFRALAGLRRELERRLS